MAEDRGVSLNAHLKDLLARTFRPPSGTDDLAESVGARRAAAADGAAAYVPHAVPDDISADEVANVARKAVADEPLDRRESLIAEAIILPDLRPAVDILGGDFAIDHPAWPDYVKDRPAHANFVRAIPSVGRVELPGIPSIPYGGTCFVVGPNLLMTNRHVAQLFAAGLGTAGVSIVDGVDPAVDFVREAGSPPSRPLGFRRMRMIHPYFDLALVEVEELDPAQHLWLEPVEADARRPRRIAVIGYPAFDPRNRADVQERVFRGLYNVKRFQPGLLNGRRDIDSFGKPVSAGCHDSSTLGGNSGSVVVDAGSGDVVGLHFAGIYKDSNFAVLAEDLAGDGRIIDAGVRIRGGGRRRSGAWDLWWTRLGTGEATAAADLSSRPPDGAGSTVSVTLPLTITVTLGQPGGASGGAGAQAASLDEAVAGLARQAPAGTVKVKAGFNGRTDCIVVAAEPASFDEILRTAPASYGGFPVEVRYATIDEQLGLALTDLEAPGAIAYDDARRSGPEFAFDEITDEPMSVIAHVGPESSFSVLKEFLADARRTLTSSMYQFFAGHVAAAVQERLEHGEVAMRAVFDPATRDPKHGQLKPGEFDRSDTFADWRERFAFENIFVRKGNGGLVASAYHIKVTVRDESWVWLSSGNWSRSSQPAPDPQTGQARGNREWHVVIRSERLARMFAAHIEADFAQSAELGGAEEAPQPAEQLVDVPEDAIVEAPVRLLEPLRIADRIVKVRPILTPDRRGRVYTDAVLELIGSATDQLVFQNQYIKVRRATDGNLDELVEALIERSKRIRDLRIILRSGEIDDDIAELRRRGMDVMRCVRVVSNTHTKGIVADGRRALVGSQNWSEQAVATNRDASLLFDDANIAGFFLEAFEIDWTRARPPAGMMTERPALPAHGAEPPPGYVRMTLAEYRNG